MNRKLRSKMRYFQLLPKILNIRALLAAALASFAGLATFSDSLISVYQFCFSAAPICPTLPESGGWHLTTTPKTTNQATASEIGKQNVFYIRFTRECEHFNGKGIKTSYGGIDVKASSRSTISLNATLPKRVGDRFEIGFDEAWPSGASSQGYFDVVLDSDGERMDGKFYSAVGDISGNAIFFKD